MCCGKSFISIFFLCLHITGRQLRLSLWRKMIKVSLQLGRNNSCSSGGFTRRIFPQHTVVECIKCSQKRLRKGQVSVRGNLNLLVFQAHTGTSPSCGELRTWWTTIYVGANDWRWSTTAQRRAWALSCQKGKRCVNCSFSMSHVFFQFRDTFFAG